MCNNIECVYTETHDKLYCEDEKMYKVYKHTLSKSVSKKDNDMVYIGITNRSPYDRWGKNGTHYKYNEHFSRAIVKYGWDNFLHEILFDGLTKKEAENLEVELIKKYNSANENFGYNKALGGSSVGKHTEKTKKIISEKAKERFRNPDNNPMYGKHHSEETKAKIAIMASQRKASEETRRKLSELNAGENNCMYGKTHTKEAREKISKALSKPVRCIETGVVYPSEIEAKRQTGVDNSMIHRYIIGNANYAGKLPDGTKLHWEYVS